MKIIDIGVNLMHRSFNVDREQVIDDAAFEGVSPLILTGTSVRNSIETVKYSSRFPEKLYCTVGVHPHDAKSCNDSTIAKLRDLAKNKCVVAIGECGLDYNRDFSPRDIQRKWFDAQIDLACELNMPLFLHERDAFNDFSEMLENRRKDVPAMVVHCFTGNEAELDKYLEMDCYIGITGWICDERRGKHLLKLVKKIPANRLMIETDAPFLTPRNMEEKPRDGRNEPKYLVHILDEMAYYLGKDIEDLADETYQNTRRFFGI
ncbi:hydrolase TatD [Dysgonomonas sp. 216]|uniref:TatD family hydrolase n=1 Tax=Dysgonomonas sp. 216 TaxID=2302934 RepID=UPI0013D62B0C|nr:TatD family hydrolase [Dysgonomonas sp. 216]NDW19878.1 hydrolase TatD [Dysgonomonas sp. 216]